MRPTIGKIQATTCLLAGGSLKFCTDCYVWLSQSVTDQQGLRQETENGEDERIFLTYAVTASIQVRTPAVNQ